MRFAFRALRKGPDSPRRRSSRWRWALAPMRLSFRYSIRCCCVPATAILFAKVAPLGGDNPEAFESILKVFLASRRPRNPVEATFIHRVAAAGRKLILLSRIESGCSGRKIRPSLDAWT